MSALSRTNSNPPGFVPNDQSTARPFWARYRVLLILIAILAVGAFFRFYGRDFDQGTNQHPDERFIVSETLAVTWPASTANLLDPRNSTLNLRRDGMPGCSVDCRYPYGSLPVYLTRVAGWALDNPLRSFTGKPAGYYLQDYNGVTLLGRSISSIFDLITILLVFLIARRLYSSKAGLIAAALAAFAVTMIQNAHFYTSDTFLTTFMMGALYFSVVMMQRPAWWAAAGAGACIGLAVATKVSVVPFALIVVAAVVLRAVYRKHTRQLGAELGDPVGVKPASARERQLSFVGHLARGLRYLVIAALFSVLAFAITEPYVLWSFNFAQMQSGGLQAVLNTNPWWQGISEQAGIQSGQSDVPYTRQYIGTTSPDYQIRNLVLWGLSPLPGIIVIVGFLVGVWKGIRGRPAEILLLAGAIPYFATLATLEAKWMRYTLPLVPILCILGAAMLLRGVQWGLRRYELLSRHGYRRAPIALMQRTLFPMLIVLAVGGAFLWSVAFMNIYSQPQSRVQASAWIYDNVPPGTSHTHEGWDDTLPLALPAQNGKPARNGSIYGQDIQFNLYDDRPAQEELNYIKGVLAQTDYIYIASNRLYGSIPRLPWRYPVQIQFYNLLYGGKLGYQLVHTSLVTPQIFGINIDDQSADESFTVYDHPRVDIFKKVSNLTDAQYSVLFSTALNRPAEAGVYSAQARGSVADDKSLQYNEPLASMPDVSGYAWNPLAQPNTQWFGVILWLIAIEIIGLIAFPVVFVVCRNLPDRGYPLAKTAGLLLVALGVWLAASGRFVPFTIASVLLMMALLAGLSFICWRLGVGSQIRAFLKEKGRLVLLYELLFLAAFGAFLIIRMLNPDLWHPTLGGEKTMEFGFLNATLRSPWMPPPDPFFSGGYINYYYYGLFIIACLIKLVGIDSGLAFNLAIPLLYAFTFTGAVSIVYNIVAWAQRRRGSTHSISRAGLAFGLLAGMLLQVIGNLDGVLQLAVIKFPQLAKTVATWAETFIASGHGGQVEQVFTTPYTQFNFWDASRIIASGNINEFPYWSYLFADLHPHLIDISVGILAITLALNLAFSGRFHVREMGASSSASVRWWRRIRSAAEWLWGSGWSGALRFVLMAAVLGATFAVNSWDFPTYAAIIAGAVLIALLLSGRAADPEQVEARQGRGSGVPAWTRWAVAVVSVGALAGISLFMYLPFFLSFKAFYTKLLPLIDGGFIPGTNTIMTRTTVAEYLVVWGLFVFVAASYLAYRLWNFPWRAAFADFAGFFSSDARTHPLPASGTVSMRQMAPRLQLAPAMSTTYLAIQDKQGADTQGAGIGYQPVPEEVSPNGGANGHEYFEPAGWLAEAHTRSDQPETQRTGLDYAYPGVLPLWAGLVMLAVTALLTLLQIATGQLLLAMLVALIGGILAVTLTTTRSASAMFCGLLLVGALTVTMGVELVYLADPLQGGPSFRMNTVFKFYEQAWGIYALGSAAAIYQILYGLHEWIATRRRANAGLQPDHEEVANQEWVPAIADPMLRAEEEPAAYPIEQTHSSDVYPASGNWLAWASEEAGAASLIAYEALSAQPLEAAAPASMNGADGEEQTCREQEAEPVKPGVRWTAGRLAWAVAFALIMAGALVFTFLGTPDRLAKRFPVTPPIGTLDGLAYMKTASYDPVVGGGTIRVNMSYEYEGINWLKQNVLGLKVIAEAPDEYYRQGGMLAAAYTGLPMVVGGLHQDEQRYPWLVGSRRDDMNRFFTTPDVQAALTIMSKYDIDYIYLGQLEQAQAGPAGMGKFRQMADPKVGILKQVFASDNPPSVPGVIIYQVVKDTRPLVGAPVQGSGIPGVSITPLPTSTPIPPPTPPTNDPTLNALIANVTANPNDRDARMKLADWYRTHNYFLDAAKQLEIVVQQDPSSIAVRQMLGDVYQSAGQPDKALKTWEDARDVDPNNPAGHNKVGIAYFDRQRYDDAIREFQAAVNIDPSWAEAWYHMGETYEAKGDVPNARNAYQKAVDNSKTPNPWQDLARNRLSKLPQ